MSFHLLCCFTIILSYGVLLIILSTIINTNKNSLLLPIMSGVHCWPSSKYNLFKNLALKRKKNPIVLTIQCIEAGATQNRAYWLKGIVTRDFGGLQMILMDRIGVPDVPLEAYSFLNFCFHIVIKFKVLSGLSFY